VSEETAGADSAPEGPSASIDPVAVALALGGASQAQADAFLKKQEAFIDDPLEDWGEALVYAGRRDEAKAQFARAVQLDLAASEKTELAEKMRP
jgi:hypothetical protein